MQLFFKYHIWSFIVIVLVIVVAFRNAWGMYFWHDDYTYIYLAQNNQLNEYPYHFFSVWINHLFRIFGLNHQSYLLLGILLYIIACCLLYLLLIRAFSSKVLSLLGTLVFASGYTGQDSIKMLLGDGIHTLIGIIAFLSTLLLFIKYHYSSKIGFLLLAFFLLLLTLDFLPTRYAGAFLILIGIDWVFSLKKRDGLRKPLMRSAVFFAIFLIQFLVHPSKFILNYSSIYADGTKILNLGQILGMVGDFQWKYFFIPFGTFWNHFFPFDYQINLSFFLSKHFSIQNLWIQSLPSFLIILVTFIILKSLRTQILSWRKIFFYLVIFLFFSAFWTRVSTFASVYPMEQVSILNGGIFFMLLVALLLLKIPAFPQFAVISLFIIFGGISVFFVVKPEFVIESYDRYLLPTAVGVPFVLSFFTSREIFEKKIFRKRLPGLTLFLLPALLLIGSHIMLGEKTQRAFVKNYSLHAQIFFSDLKSYLPQISEKKIIYIEGATKELSFAVGDAARVGEFGSETVYSVHYGTNVDNVLLPESPDDIISLLRENPDVSIEDVYYFIYTAEGLKNLSEGFRMLFKSDSQPTAVSPGGWRKRDNDLVLDTKFSSQLPIKVKLLIKAASKVSEKRVPLEEEVEIKWRYDTIGPLPQENFVRLTILPDNKWHNYEFLIPGGGEYLKEVVIAYDNFGLLHVGDMILLHVK